MLRNQRLVRLWKERQRKNAPRMQGTESHAMEQLARNRASFQYPADGFCQPIEYTLLYAMLSAPDTYPCQAVQELIDEEDFLQYLHTNDGKVHYGQLSAILAYSAERYPSTNSDLHNPKALKKYHSDNELSSTSKKQELSVSQSLCKKILHTVVQYAEEHDLDRETELHDVLDPVKKVAAKRAEQTELKSLLPLYLGYSAALMTANPLPLLVGTLGLAAVAGENRHELENVDRIISETDRVADVERTGLLEYS